MENGKYVIDSIDYDYSSCLSSLTQFLLDAGHRAVNTTVAAAAGHHFIPRSIWQDLDKSSRSWKVLDKLTSRALKNPRLSNPYDKLHRGVNKQTRELLEKLEKDTGKSVRDFDRGDWEKLGEELERAGGDIEAFNERLANYEPEARTLSEAMYETLNELFPAAADAVVVSGEAAAEIGAIIP